ncbi:hypothetical protein [Teredinibacter sp. KSP-S5-2]|uniref:hypothetical protein n=1 Tax=Teredinibacter sp. KSP-S5-2 TaxID=3034506 RepID=UPI002934C5A8|nr:hypothetical protein [Teredinibacter sp. KSP-S5-2]WNO10314.1 hypothetical protein P5V12_03920 [Teredinibacter sp. KSP-S5-2]
MVNAVSRVVTDGVSFVYTNLGGVFIYFKTGFKVGFSAEFEPMFSLLFGYDQDITYIALDVVAVVIICFLIKKIKMNK